MPTASWLQPADPASYFATGVDLSLKMQQARDRKKQLKAMSDFHQQQLDTQLDRLQETARYHDQLRDKNQEMMDLRLQIATTKNDTELAKLQEKYDALDASAKRLQANLASKEAIATQNNATRQRGQDITSADRRYLTDWNSFDRERGQDMSAGTAANRLSLSRDTAKQRATDAEEGNEERIKAGLVEKFLPLESVDPDNPDKALKSAQKKADDTWESIQAHRQAAKDLLDRLHPLTTAAAAAPSPAAGTETPDPGFANRFSASQQGMGDRLQMDAWMNAAQKKPLDMDTARQFLKQAGGDKAKARALAQAAGYSLTPPPEQ